MKLKQLLQILHKCDFRLEAYVDERYKGHLKNEGKAEAVSILV